jgi:carbamate kinase
VRVVVALGGNALLERGERPDSDVQESRVTQAVAALAPLLVQHDLIVTHGNGPQVGLLAADSAADPALSHPYPFDVLGAQTQGMIGYWLVQALGRALPRRKAACLVCRTLVSADDPAFAAPAKFVGPVYRASTARRLAAERGWQVRRDGTGWRRVVPSPEPTAVIELDLIDLLASLGVIVVCAGGGGIPVIAEEGGGLRGVQAVVDKDLTAALLARAVGADALLLLTDVPAVLDGYGTRAARPIHRADPAWLRSRLDAGAFPAGSMGPKVEAACRFATATGGLAAIGCLGDAADLLAGRAGTIVRMGQ